MDFNKFSDRLFGFEWDQYDEEKTQLYFSLSNVTVKINDAIFLKCV